MSYTQDNLMVSELISIILRKGKCFICNDHCPILPQCIEESIKQIDTSLDLRDRAIIAYNIAYQLAVDKLYEVNPSRLMDILIK